MSVYLICYAASFLFSEAGYYKLSGLVLIFAAVNLYWYDYRQSKNLIHLRGLFSLFWVGGEGISCFKLSNLQTEWGLMTWVCFLLALAGFWFTFEFLSRTRGNPNEEHVRRQDFKGHEIPLFVCLAVITAVSLIAFIFEAVVLGFIPFFVKSVPHAYSTFHISGVHYFTVSCVLVPALSALYFFVEKGRSGIRACFVLAMNLVALSIPILCVSRFQLILAVGMAVFTYAALQSRLNIFYGIGLAAAMIPIYIILTIARGHDISYLNGIFEMKSSNMPIFVTQPYMYVANNYDNFNCLVDLLPKHTFGLRMLFPLWALTGLKFLVPSLVNFPIYVTKEELTTVTLFYDAYYDFGILGVLAFSCLLGAVCYLLVRNLKRMRNPVIYLFYVQVAMYMVFSFFTTWFSNPATWFYLVVTGIVYACCSFRKRR